MDLTTSYSDYILSRDPEIYIRFNEPLGHFVYLDSSGKENHLSMMGSLSASVGGVNQSVSSFSGDPGSGIGIALPPASNIIGTNGIIPCTATPDFRSNLPRKKTGISFNYIGNTDIIVDRVWGCVTIDSVNRLGDSCGETWARVATWGPIQLYCVTKTRCENNQKILESVFLSVGSIYIHRWISNNLMYSNTQYVEFYRKTNVSGIHRIAAGVRYISDTSFEYSVIDGDASQSGVVTLASLDIFSIQNTYTNNGVSYSNCVMSNYAMFYNQNFPDSQWASLSWGAHQQTYSTSITTMDYGMLGCDIKSYRITSLPGKIIGLFDSVLLHGSNHFLIKRFVCIGKMVEAIFSEVPGGILQPHSFIVNSFISIHNASQTQINGIWRILEVKNTSVVFEILSNANDEIPIHGIAKSPPLGPWKRVNDASEVSYQSLHASSLLKKIKVDDSDPKTTKVRLSSRDNLNSSNSLFIKKNLKSSINMEPEKVRWAAFGDSRRVYFFIGYRQDSISHTNLIAFGDIKDLYDDAWKTVLIAFDNNTIGNPGFNFSFSYPQLSIMPSGHLLCRLSTQINSDIRWIESDGVNPNAYHWCYGDVGQHIYPISIPHTHYTP